MRNSCKIQLNELVYYLFFGLMLFAKGMGLYEGQWPYTITLIVGGLLILLKIAITEHTLIEWGGIIGLSSLGMAIFASSHKIGILVIIATIIGIKGASVKRIMIIGTVIWSSVFVVQCGLTIFGVRDDIIKVQEKLGLGYIFRYSLGSTHPNVLQITYILLCFFWIYILRVEGKKLIVFSFWSLVGGLYTFLYSVSYTGFLLTVLFLVINFYFSSKKKIGFIDRLGAMSVIPFCVWITLYEFNNYYGKYYYYLNKYLNTRPFITWNFMQHNKITLFGTGYCEDIPLELNNLDSSYVYALMHYGIIFFVLFICGYMFLIYYLCKKNMRIELGIVLTMAIGAITEPFFVNESFKNITWIFIANYLFVLLNFISENINCQSFCLLRKYESYSIEISTFRMSILLDVAHEIKRKNATCLVLISCCIGVLSASFYYFNGTINDTYYVDKRIVQTSDKNFINIDMNNLPKDFNGKIIGYKSPDTPMYEVKGNIGMVEHYRKSISIFVWSGFWFFLISFVILIINEQNKRKRCI